MEIRISTTREAGNACVCCAGYLFLYYYYYYYYMPVHYIRCFFRYFCYYDFFFFIFSAFPPRSGRVPRYYNVTLPTWCVFVPHLTFVRQTGTGIKTSSRFSGHGPSVCRDLCGFVSLVITGPQVFCMIYIIYVYTRCQ